MSITETELKIRLYGDPVLRKKAKAVRIVSDKERELLDMMLSTMRSSGGIGLSAPQVGIDKAMIVAEVPGKILKIVDPKIIKNSGSDILEEGCLSIPGVCVEINRPSKIVVGFLNEDNKKTKLELDGILARIIQHEMDHLIGKLIVDYACITKKIALRNKLKKIEQEYNEKLRQPETKSCQLPL